MLFQCKTVSWCLLWRFISYNWLDGNWRLKACFEAEVSLYTLKYLGAQSKVQKTIFEPDQKAMSKLGNCLKMAKSGNVFVKPTLELNLRSMDASQVQRPLPR
ncbi:unnamed protein product [Linum trigynum]|uniref:Uncharacterized protein n=1 Tax=Linum trigynum TaxID=586398 RepID=A0AAV2CYR5_9ROSI